MQAVSDAMARAGDLESNEPPSNASSRVEWAPSTCSSSEQSATGTHFLGGAYTTPYPSDARLGYCLRVGGFETKRTWYVGGTTML